MKNVKRIFFLTEEEANKTVDKNGSKYVDHQSPHFELDDGTIMYGKLGWPEGPSKWHAPLN